MPREPAALLSRRQFDCLQGVADHLDSVQIGARLGISKHTVDSHLTAAVAAMQAASRRDAVRRYVVLQTTHPEKITGQFLRVSDGALPAPAGVVPAVVQETAPPFEWQPSPSTTAQTGADHDVNSTLHQLAIVAGIAVAIVILIIAIEPLAESAMRMANRIQPFHHHN